MDSGTAPAFYQLESGILVERSHDWLIANPTIEEVITEFTGSASSK